MLAFGLRDRSLKTLFSEKVLFAIRKSIKKTTKVVTLTVAVLVYKNPIHVIFKSVVPSHTPRKERKHGFGTTRYQAYYKLGDSVKPIRIRLALQNLAQCFLPVAECTGP